jgi:hypothetical protein
MPVELFLRKIAMAEKDFLILFAPQELIATKAREARTLT